MYYVTQAGRQFLSLVLEGGFKWEQKGKTWGSLRAPLPQNIVTKETPPFPDPSPKNPLQQHTWSSPNQRKVTNNTFSVHFPWHYRIILPNLKQKSLNIFSRMVYVWQMFGLIWKFFLAVCATWTKIY